MGTRTRSPLRTAPSAFSNRASDPFRGRLADEPVARDSAAGVRHHGTGTDAGSGGLRALARGDGVRVLLVSDDADVVGLVEPTLDLAHYSVETVRTVSAAWRRVESVPYGLIVVDMNVPDLLDIPRQGRGDGTPMLFLAESAFLDLLLSELSLSGKDYVPKPFRVTDFLVRIWLLTRGCGEDRPAPLLRHGELFLDDTMRRAWRGDDELPLTPAEYRLLRYLLLNTGRVLSKEHIAYHLWDEYRGDNAIERLVSRLRRKVGDTGAELVRTHHGFGYTIDCPRR
ncbi:response regulator transcription factor [Nocardiopsis dassonvillei]|uniref:response regulator transcription factor n=1 Tax=Nocardiopsis dassonvillei TaxID=2014 RepID=UPI00200F2168|nr:response regulator transcription factor [Nocardiopsis dassonvillei]MCK9873915.1 response regulator transcription factor [Nocardiopsis dassonvillei]